MYYTTREHQIKDASMLALLLKDPWTYIASLMTTFFVSIQWIAQNLTPVVTLLGALIGIVVLSIGLIIKIKEKSNVDLDEKIKLLEIKKLEQELGN